MYIRRTHTNNSATGERYHTYRLVANQRIGGKPRQTTLLNLGRHFAVDQDQWPGLCARINELVSHQSPLFPMDLASSVEQEAQRIAAQLVARQAEVQPANTAASTPEAAPVDIQSVDVESLELTRPRSVGVEQVGLWSMQQLGFMALLSELGINPTQISAIVGSIIARMAAPSSELAAHGWLGAKSGLGELLGCRLRDQAADESLPGFRCVMETPYRHRTTLIRARQRPVRAVHDGDAVRFDQYLL